jgi:hypothetical protein
MQKAAVEAAFFFSFVFAFVWMGISRYIFIEELQKSN